MLPESRLLGKVCKRTAYYIGIGKLALSQMSKSKWAVVFAVVAVAFLLLVLFTGTYMRPPGKADVAIYAGRGTWEDSVRAAQNMFRWMNLTVELVSAEFINDNGLEGFRILCVPGGSMYDYAQDISSKGKENMRAFVRDGGGYVGICGGAYFAAESLLAKQPTGYDATGIVCWRSYWSHRRNHALPRPYYV